MSNKSDNLPISPRHLMPTRDENMHQHRANHVKRVPRIQRKSTLIYDYLYHQLITNNRIFFPYEELFSVLSNIDRELIRSIARDIENSKQGFRYHYTNPSDNKQYTAILLLEKFAITSAYLDGYHNVQRIPISYFAAYLEDMPNDPPIQIPKRNDYATSELYFYYLAKYRELARTKNAEKA